MKSYSSLWVHLIWTTKNREPLLHKNWRISLFKFIKEDTNKKEIIIDTINGIEDHIQLLVRLLPRQSISNITKQCKGSSSHWINQQNFMDVTFAWQAGYAAISVSPSEIDKVRQYIFNQEKHHKNWKLNDEIEKFKFYSKQN